MLFRCHWCQGQFEPPHTGRQRCPKCGSELDVKETPPPPPLPPLADLPKDPDATRWSGGDSFHGPWGPSRPPGGGLPPEDPFFDGEPSPWERSEEKGVVRALMETWVAATFHPTAFFRNLKSRPIGPAFIYGWLLSGAAMGFHALWFSIEGLAFSDAESMIAGPFIFLAWIFASAVSIWISAFLAHVGCMMFGCNTRGFEATFRALAYAQSPQLFSVVPIIGGLVSFIWSLVVSVIALREMQRTTTAKSLTAIVVPWVILFTLVTMLGVAAVLTLARDLPRW